MQSPQLIGAPELFVASDGVQWSVGEYTHVNGDGDAHCLIFECDGVIRRVRGFPADWRGLGPAALLALSWSR